MPPQHKQLKLITLTVAGQSWEGQIRRWELDPGEQDGDQAYTFSPDGAFTEDTTPEPTLLLEFYADWRANGISDYLWTHRGETAVFVLDHNPDDAASHVRWTGSIVLKAPTAGGEARTNEVGEVTFQCQGMPTYTHV